MAGDGDSDLYVQLDLKMVVGKTLIDKLQPLLHIKGMEKLKRKIDQDVVFLKKIFDSKTAKEHHVSCTNINHFNALVECVLTCTEINAVLESFYCNESRKKIVVDIICDNGRKWIKVIGKNPKALTELSIGNGAFGERNVFDQVKEYTKTAKQHMCMYRHPEVVFHFAAGIERVLYTKLASMGITVSGSVIEGSFYDLEGVSCLSEDDDTKTPNTISENNNATTADICTNILNLDVTTLLAYVSSLTNTDNAQVANYKYSHKILQQQAEVERHQPVKPLLEKMFQGKELVCCESAAESFMSIVKTVGGPSENARAKKFMERVRVVADYPDLPETLRIKTNGQVSSRSLTVFSTGHNLKAITVSANENFIRSAKSQGVEFAYLSHPARALTEKKMITIAQQSMPKIDGTTSSEAQL